MKIKPTVIERDSYWVAYFGIYATVDQWRNKGRWDAPRILLSHGGVSHKRSARALGRHILAACDYAEKNDRRKK